MNTDLPASRTGRKKVRSDRRYSHRVVFRLQPHQFARLVRRASEHGMEPNDYARDRALARIRPTRAQRRLAAEVTYPLEEVSQFVTFAHSLLGHLASRLDPASELGAVVKQARERFVDPIADMVTVRSLVERAVHP